MASGLPLQDKWILITGAARRIGRLLALACAQAGGNVIVHHGHSAEAATRVQEEIVSLGGKAHVISADLSNPEDCSRLMAESQDFAPLFALVNNAAIFESLGWEATSWEDWDRHLAVNLTAPFLLSQAFARQIPKTGHARIVNILDWRALRPGTDHFPYTISKAALASLTKSLAAALAPNIVVNGLALGAVLPPSDGAFDPEITNSVPAKRWAKEEEIERALLFLLTCPTYITGEIIHVDGGRHLV